MDSSSRVGYSTKVVVGARNTSNTDAQSLEVSAKCEYSCPLSLETELLVSFIDYGETVSSGDVSRSWLQSFDGTYPYYPLVSQLAWNDANSSSTPGSGKPMGAMNTSGAGEEHRSQVWTSQIPTRKARSESRSQGLR